MIRDTDLDITTRDGSDGLEIERYELRTAAPYRFEIERRTFMRLFAAMGGGLLVVATIPPAAAQESGRGGQNRALPREIEGWLHIDEKGRVTGYTGKTEIGQNIRTSLAQAIADELRVSLASVSTVMADTDLVPYDAGTFGSQSTPRMAPQLARAAASAREMLIDRAAALWKVDRATLNAKNGEIVGAEAQAIAYGELTRGQRLAGAIAAETTIAAPAQWTLRGTAPRKVNGRDIVTGRHVFTPDLVRPRMQHGCVIRPAGYAGSLVSVDDSRARAIPGVTVVRDAEFVGVVAPTERLARQAASAVRADWRVPQDHPSSSTIYEHLKKTARDAGGRNTPTLIGDPVTARASASRRLDASYLIPYIAHVPLEPRAAVAEWTDGKLTVWCGTQRPFGVRSQLAEAFHIPEDRVRVIVPDTAPRTAASIPASMQSRPRGSQRPRARL